MSNTFSDRRLTIAAPASDAPSEDFSLEAYRAMDGIELTLSAELGRRPISVQDLLRLRIDDVLILPRPAGENVDLFAEDVLIGSAEMQTSDERLSIRVADLVGKPVSLNQSRKTDQPKTDRAQEGGDF